MIDIWSKYFDLESWIYFFLGFPLEFIGGREGKKINQISFFG